MNTRSHVHDQTDLTPQELAQAVSLRLFELSAFHATSAGANPGPCANQTPSRRQWSESYLPPGQPPLFRVHS